MPTEVIENWAPFAQSVGLGLFPWISQFQALDIHFNIPNLNIKSISNFFANLFSSSIFFYISQSLPYEVIGFPKWWVFIIASFILTISYFTIYLFFKEDVAGGNKKWLVIVNFLSYVFIFCLLTTGFGLLKVYEGHYVLDGKVESLGKPVAEATIIFKNEEGSTITEFKTNQEGKFVFVLEKKVFDTCSECTVLADGFKDKTMLLSPSTIIETIENINLSKKNETKNSVTPAAD
jgi:hypothetical protein